MEGCTPPPRLHIALADGHDQIAWGLAPVGTALAAEFERLGIELTWSEGNEPAVHEVLTLRVIILPHTPKDWRMPAEALAGVLREDGRSSPIFVFYPSVEKVLGTPFHIVKINNLEVAPREWFLGLARIIEHEIIHVVLPEKAHDKTGIFAANLRTRALVKRKFELEPATRALLVARLCASQVLRTDYDTNLLFGFSGPDKPAKDRLGREVSSERRTSLPCID